MPPTALPIITPKAPFDIVAANELDFVFTAADVANGNKLTCTGKEIILVQNSDAGAQTITVTSVVDEKNRVRDITAYSFAAGEFGAITVGLTTNRGWMQTDGTILISASSANVKFAVMRLPTQ